MIGATVRYARRAYMLLLALEAGAVIGGFLLARRVANWRYRR